MEVLQRQERALPGLASDLTQRQKADNGLTIRLAGSVSAIRDVGLIRSPAQQTIVFERVMLAVNSKTKPGYIHLLGYTLNVIKNYSSVCAIENCYICRV